MPRPETKRAGSRMKITEAEKVSNRAEVETDSLQEHVTASAEASTKLSVNKRRLCREKTPERRPEKA